MIRKLQLMSKARLKFKQNTTVCKAQPKLNRQKMTTSSRMIFTVNCLCSDPSHPCMAKPGHELDVSLFKSTKSNTHSSGQSVSSPLVVSGKPNSRSECSGRGVGASNTSVSTMEEPKDTLQKRHMDIIISFGNRDLIAGRHANNSHLRPSFPLTKLYLVPFDCIPATGIDR